jgi:hypothetical protein
MGTCRETTSGYALTVLWRIGQPLARVARRGGAAGFSGIFEIVATDEAGGGRLKKETHLRGNSPFTPWDPIGPCSPYLPDGRRARERLRMRSHQQEP